jgi:hypothetical protein
MLTPATSKPSAEIAQDIAVDLTSSPDTQHQQGDSNPQQELDQQSQPVQAGHVLLVLESDGLTQGFLPAIASLVQAIEQIGEKPTRHQGQPEQQQADADAVDYQPLEVRIADPAGNQASEQGQADEQRGGPLVTPVMEPAQQPDNPDDIENPDHVESHSGQRKHDLAEQALRPEFLHQPPDQRQQEQHAAAPAQRPRNAFRQAQIVGRGPTGAEQASDTDHDNKVSEQAVNQIGDKGQIATGARNDRHIGADTSESKQNRRIADGTGDKRLNKSGRDVPILDLHGGHLGQLPALHTCGRGKSPAIQGPRQRPVAEGQAHANRWIAPPVGS